MARPRKMKTEQMLELVDIYFTDEVKGNTRLLKSSLLAKYALTLGHTVSGYDFRRNAEVIAYIEELKRGDPCKTSTIVYRNIDAQEFIRNNRSTAKLIKALTELDDYYCKVCQNASKMLKQNNVLVKADADMKEQMRNVTQKADQLSIEVKVLTKENRELALENRYLRKMLKTHLYPAVANEILADENLLKKTNAQVKKNSIAQMSELMLPKSFEASVEQDMALLSDEENLLKKLWEQCDV